MKKGSRDYHHSFVGIERRLLRNCPEFRDLTPRAIVLYLHLKSKYNGANNGFISLHYSEVKGAKGFKSDKAISAAFKELKKQGWIEITSIGGMFRHQNLYRLTAKTDKFGITNVRPGTPGTF